MAILPSHPSPTPSSSSRPHHHRTNILARQNPSLSSSASPPDTTPTPTICGYGSGGKGWKAPSGSKCMVDTSAGYFGFCPESKSNAKDCGFARACVDLHACTSGCGRMGEQPYGTASCTATDEPYCYTQHLLATAPSSPNQSSPLVTATYTYLGCGKKYRSPPPEFTIAPDILPQAALALSASTSESATPEGSILSEEGRKEGSDSTGAIIGGVLGGIGVLCLIVFVVFYILRQRRRRSYSSTYPSPPPTRSLLSIFSSTRRTNNTETPTPKNKRFSQTSSSSSRSGTPPTTAPIHAHTSKTAKKKAKKRGEGIIYHEADEKSTAVYEADTSGGVYEMGVPAVELDGEGTERRRDRFV
ncbi:unnamed protein product [Periconia digitata]|uniref:Uncharacterized protein n=1 Tax=Periconia digitata TaxID=1303443 RepID=A0A9W4UDJ2_9PLEO|nr:unnamed protein product [Periconia digitata]